MKKDKKNKDLQELNIAELEDIIQAPQSDPDPQQKFEETIKMGERIIRLDTTDKEE